MKLQKRTWASVIGILVAVGGVLISTEIWVNGAENYESSSRRGGLLEAVFAWIGGLIGDKPLAVSFSLLMAAAGYGIHKIGSLIRD